MTQDMAALVERLCEDTGYLEGFPVGRSLRFMAADAIRSLLADIERLERERDEWKDTSRKAYVNLSDRHAALVTLHKDAAELREALKPFADESIELNKRHWWYPFLDVDDFRRARAAYKGEGNG